MSTAGGRLVKKLCTHRQFWYDVKGPAGDSKNGSPTLQGTMEFVILNSSTRIGGTVDAYLGKTLHRVRITLDRDEEDIKVSRRRVRAALGDFDE